MTGLRRLVGVAVVFVLLIGGCEIVGRLYTQEDSFAPPRLDHGSIVAVVDAEVIESRPPRGKEERNYGFVALDIRYQRGPYPVLGDDRPIVVPAPEEGAVFEAAVDPAITLTPGMRTTLVLEAWAVDGTSIFDATRWHARLILDAEGAPVPGTPSTLVEDLELITAPGIPAVDAIVALAEDLEAYGRAVAEAHRAEAKATGDPTALAPPAVVAALPVGETMARLQERDSSTVVHPTPHEWLARPDTTRQLPLDEEALSDLPAEIRTALDTDRWVRWTVLVTYEPGLADEVAYVGLLFPGVGYLGPYGTDPVGFTSVTGYAPPEVPFELLVWAPGIPAETVAGMEQHFDEDRLVPARRLPIPGPAAPRLRVPPDGGIVVRLESERVTAVRIVDAEEILDIVEGHAPARG